MRRYRYRTCVSYKDGATGASVDISWNEMERRVRQLGCYLLSAGVEKCDRVGLFPPQQARMVDRGPVLKRW
ncbi:MAG: hypothetical protein E4G96_04990 [Chrysiogenales bacterium]|nr:MAG: hypothetical protein E4G96_04990 [Chrysiogenales bacterium]